MNLETSKCPFHRILRRLRVFAGLPVPVTVKWHDGKPDFRDTDPEQWIRVMTQRLCGVCGEKLGDTCYFIGGDKSVASGMFADPWMHQTCAMESARLCPFLSGKRTEYRGDDIKPLDVQDSSNRPARMFVVRTHTKRVEVVDLGAGNIVIRAGRIEVVHEF